MVQTKKGTRPPWVGLAAAVWVQLAAANAYTFPLYSDTLKSVLGYDQQQLTLLGVADDIGENFGIIPGILCTWLPPWLILGAGTMLCFVGYGVVWLAVTKTVVSLPFWALWLALLLGSNSSAWLITTVLVTNMKNFPHSRGTVSGLLKGYVGLCAAVLTQLFSGILNKSPTDLLCLLSLGLPLICLLMVYFVRPCTPATEDDESQHGHFLFTQIACVILAIYLLGTTVFDEVLPKSRTAQYAMLGVTALLLMSPLAIPIKMTLFRSPYKVQPDRLASQGNLEPLLPPALTQTYIENSIATSDDNDDEDDDIDMLLAVGEGAVKMKRRPRRGEDFEFHEALVKADFWLLFFAYFIGVGSGVTVMNSLAQIAYAARNDAITILLCLFSLGNFFGRLAGGAVSEHLVKSRMLPRPVLMTCTQTVMVMTYLFLALALEASLYAATACLGICYGVQFSVMIPTTSELFGLKNFGLFYNFMALGNPIGAFLFSSLLAGYLYDMEAAKGSTGTSCVGPNCFRLTFFILGGFCALGTFLSIILSVRIKPVYQMLYGGGPYRTPRSSLH
ncbi:Major facilitator superfamily protein [Rhynchospora pubera]|uniref:Major facilitator superfamily protein n=1 Tax=Rhynchospora pubera TaxID=906938 RepID=A0AAV8BTX4_9POAL|nr:Major facilitator superfamily protein [Rhynchospora pubera]